MTRLSLWAQGSQSMLGVSRVAGQGLRHLFVDDHIYLHASFRSSLDDLVEAPFLIEKCWASQEEFRG